MKSRGVVVLTVNGVDTTEKALYGILKQCEKFSKASNAEFHSLVTRTIAIDKKDRKRLIAGNSREPRER